MSDQPIQYPYSKVIRADGVDYVDDDDHNKQEHQLEALTERVGGTWTTATRPTPSVNVPHPIGYNMDLPGYEFWNGSAWVSTGGAGLLEPGLMMCIDPEKMVEFGPGFAPWTPALLMTKRPLLPVEQIILLVETNAPEANLVAVQAPSIPSPVGTGNFWTDFYFAPFGQVVVPYYYTSRVMAVIGVWNTALSRWVDKMCVIVESAPL